MFYLSYLLRRTFGIHWHSSGVHGSSVRKWQSALEGGRGGTFGKLFPRNEAVQSLGSILSLFGEAQTEFRSSAGWVSERPPAAMLETVTWVGGGVNGTVGRNRENPIEI